MARKRAAAKLSVEHSFVEKLAAALISSNPHIDPQDPAVSKAFNLAVASLPDGPQKTALQEHAAQYATALQEALAAAARPATQPASRPRKRQKAAKASESVPEEAGATPERPDATAAQAAADSDAAAGTAQPPLEHALVDDAAYLQHVRHAGMRDRHQHVTRHAVEDAIHGGEAAALLQARAPPPEELLRLYGAPHNQLIADREFVSLDVALSAAQRCLALGAALSRQCGPGDDPAAGLAAMIVPLCAAVRLQQQQQQQQQPEGAGAAGDGLQPVAALAARALAVLSLRRRGSGSAASPAAAGLAASWLAAPQPGAEAAAPGDELGLAAEPGLAAETVGEWDAAIVAPPAAIVLLRAELRLLQHASEVAADPAGRGLALSQQQLRYGRPDGAAVAAAAADLRVVAGDSALPLVQLLLRTRLPVAGTHSRSAAVTLWRVLLHAALQSGNAETDYLARLCLVQRAHSELMTVAGAQLEAGKASAQAKRLVPPPALLSWLKGQPPSGVVTGALAAVGRGHPQAVTAFLLDDVAPRTLQALLRSWMAAQRGMQDADGIDGAPQPAGDAATADGDLLFYVSTEGDAAAAAAPSGESGSEDGDPDSDDDAGLDLAVLPGSGSDSGGGAD